MPLESTRDPSRRARRAVLAAFAVLTAVFTGAFPPFRNPNELSRLESVYAIVEQGTFAIDGAIPVLGDHEDKALSGGRTFSNKAPGLALAGVPVYRLLRAVLPAPRDAAAPLFVLLHVLTVGLAGVVAVARLLRRLPARVAPLVGGAVALGTPFLYYSRTYLSHAWSAALLFLAWDLVKSAEERMARRRVGPLVFLGGFLVAWALISEYTVAPFAVFLVLRVGAGREWRRMAIAAAGAAVPVLLLLAYQAVCFGSPFTPSYAREAYPAYAELARRPLFGLSWPNGRVLLDYLFHPARGLLVFSPFLAWAVAGFAKWWRSGDDRADCLFAASSCLAFLVLMSGYPNWHGGWSLGSRYLVPALFFVSLGAARALESSLSRFLFAAAAIFSIAQHAVLSLTWPHFPTNVPWPAGTASAWFLGRGWVAPSLLPASVSGRAAAALLAAGAAAAALALAVRAAAPLSPRPAWAAAAGLVPLVLLLARPPELSYGGRLWRAAVFGKYSGLDPERQEIRRVAATAGTPSEKQRAEDAWRLFGPDP